jgi:hypothetical protein
MKTRVKFLMVLLAVCVSLHAQQLAFPGAQGFGRFATGGRTGSVYHVTNLNDSGTGSLRDAVSQPNRIVVFDVCGTIYLKSGLVFAGNLTVLGQTAPGEGVQVYGDRVSFSSANNLIVRYMRFRMGKGGTSGKDAAGVANGRNMIFDHLSVLWGRDECFSISWDNKGTEPADITVQNSIIGQGLQTHSCGGLIQTQGGVTLYRNLYIENKTRNPKVKGLNQFVNNVVYNWGNGGCYLMGRESSGNSWADIENNYFVRGPWNSSTKPLSEGNENFQFYGAGNYYDNNTDGVLNGVAITDSEYAASGALRRPTLGEITNLPKPFPVITEKMTAEQALLWMIDSVGPCLPARDEVDKYLIDEMISYGKLGSTDGISDEKTLPHKGTGTLYTGNKPKDTDGDGIPDEWEIANGLNPNNAADAMAIAANGYANIENYSFSIVRAYPYIKNPSNFQVTGQKKESVSLKWTDNADNETGYIIEYSTDNKTFQELARIEANSTTYVATGLNPETVYYFRIKAYGEDGLVSPYATLTTETLGDPSAPKPCINPSPAVNAEVGVAEGGVTLTWENLTKNYDGTVMYLVYFGKDADNLSRVATTTAKSYEYTGTLDANTTYYWRVNAKNNIGSTEGPLWSFKTVEGGTLFYTDFNTTPAAFHDKFPGTGNVNIINGNTSTVVAGMTFGANGSSSARIVSFSDSGLTGDYSADDAGATARCVEFTSGSGYVQLPEVEGPCTITIWTGNSDTNSKTFNLKTIVGGTETTATSFTLANAKKNFKHKYTYMGNGKVVFKVDGNGKKFRIHDILIEKYVAEDVNAPIEIKTYPEKDKISYMDGSMTFRFNQDVVYKGGATINGDNYERLVSVTAAGPALTVTYEGLDVNSDYAINFPEGSITDLKGVKTFSEEFEFSTCDFGPLEKISETHKGRAAVNLPIDFKPFNTIALLERENGTTQESGSEHPHWVQVSGDVTADKAVFTSTSDKVMTFFASASPAIRVKVDYSGTANVEFKIQETRNADMTPGWRTIRVLRNADFPFDGLLYLNSESRFVKLVPAKLSGSVTLSEFRVADAEGKGLGEGFDIITGIQNIHASELQAPEYFTLKGERVAIPAHGLYIMRATMPDGTVVSRKVSK